MGRKKRKLNIDLKPFCYYCDREFDDEKILIQHQKAKHFKCLHCNRKLDMANGLVVHMMQVHKTNLKSVPNALPKRNDPELVIRGMNGVPTDIIEENLIKLKQKLGDKNIKRQQRVNWAQVTMAPTMEQFLKQAQMGNFSFPGFNSPVLPTNNNILTNTLDINNKSTLPNIPLYIPNTTSNINNINNLLQQPIGNNIIYPPKNSTLLNMPIPPINKNNINNHVVTNPNTFTPSNIPPNIAHKYSANINLLPTNINQHNPMYMPPGLYPPPIPPLNHPSIPPTHIPSSTYPTKMTPIQQMRPSSKWDVLEPAEGDPSTLKHNKEDNTENKNEEPHKDSLDDDVKQNEQKDNEEKNHTQNCE
ncbi:zinc finger protein, putative [Plasmodium reichenowi]|uniref:Zinc finger protein, putative n=1 Tax=Plasmodium reichenowi TaxID=5854 RepID=A0A151LF11_PLARE|nr:zinc finger protein, putative [Plasmodium reichenowi]KYN97540.1 zinc finger protein, putative [Plasmodium reichenowi]